VNRSDVPLEKVLSNILMVGRVRPVIIQSLFPAINGEEPPLEEVEQYVAAWLTFPVRVRTFSWCRYIPPAGRPQTPKADTSRSRSYSRIAHTVRQTSGLRPKCSSFCPAPSIEEALSS